MHESFTQSVQQWECNKVGKKRRKTSFLVLQVENLVGTIGSMLFYTFIKTKFIKSKQKKKKKF